MDDACALIPCVHQPSFYQSLDRIYDLSTDEYSTQDQRFLPLLYVVIALGCLFAKDEDSKELRKISRSLHYISIQNSLLHHEIAGLKEVLKTQKKHKNKSKTLNLQQKK